MKSSIPDTRNSLIVSLRDRDDAEAWDQFVSIYEPLIYRLARAKGFQDADAREIVQEVLVAVSRAVDRWQPDAERGRFRDWLFRIAKNLIINFMTRRRHQSIASRDGRIGEILNQHADPAHNDSDMIDLEYRREVFRWAAEHVKSHVKEATWQAFWMTSVEQASISQAAETLGISIGAVHIARSRVRSRLREQVLQWNDEQGGPNES